MDDKDEDLKIIVFPQVQESMDNDPELAEAMKEFFANVHQAHEGVRSGRYASFEDAMEAITGNRPERVEMGDEDDDS